MERITNTQNTRKHTERHESIYVKEKSNACKGDQTSKCKEINQLSLLLLYRTLMSIVGLMS